jgi:hypothetical protein
MGAPRVVCVLRALIALGRWKRYLGARVRVVGAHERLRKSGSPVEFLARARIATNHYCAATHPHPPPPDHSDGLIITVARARMPNLRRSPARAP